MRVTRSKTGMRRSHHQVKPPALTSDQDGVPHLKHRASLTTGTYRGRQVVDVERKLEKKQAKQQAAEQSNGSAS